MPAVAVTRRPAGVVRALPVVLAVATVASQIAYPLVSGAARHRLTVASVALFFASSFSHALIWRGPRFAAVLLAITAGGGLLVEAMGVATGMPFGSYAYSGTLGADLLGVPLIIPLAWTMMAYPALLVGRRIDARLWPGAFAAGAALASWDLFLDPQMVAEGHWRWEATAGPGLLGVPLTNFVAWLVVGTTMMALLWRLPRRAAVRPKRSETGAGRQALGDCDDRVPFGLYLWTYASSVLAHAAFFGLPESAVAGGIGMGAVVMLWLRAVRK